jgi:hypothetical protein
VGQVGGGDELEIDVRERPRAVEADEQARLADVLADERGEERPETRRDGLAVAAEHLRLAEPASAVADPPKRDER